MDYANAAELITKAALIDGVETTIRPAKILDCACDTVIEIVMRKGVYSRATLIDWRHVKECENGEEMLMHMLKDNLFHLLRFPYCN